MESFINPSIKKQIWNGYVPVLFSMSKNEIVSKKEPGSVFLLLPRISYLPLVTNKLRTYFIPYAATLSDGMWFKFNDYVLKWNIPIGVLYDLFTTNSNEKNPVWKLTVHFQSYPADDIIMRCDNINTVQSLYFNVLKQAVFMGYNNINCIAGLKKNDQNTLWNAVCKANYDIYLPIYKLIFTQSSSNKLKRYPVRILLQGFDPLLDLVPIQRPVNVTETMTLNKYLMDIIPGIMIKNTENSKQISIIIQGIKMPLSVPLLWLIYNASAADCFLYILVIQH